MKKDEIRKDKGRKNENQAFLLGPLFALTESLSLSQPDAVSNLHTYDIPRQLFLTSSKLGLSEAIV